MQRRHWHLHIVLEHVVDPQAHDAAVRARLDVDVAGPLVHRLAEDDVGELHDRLGIGLGVAH